MKNILLLCLVLVGCQYDLDNCMECEEIKIAPAPEPTQSQLAFPAVDKNDPDTCDRSNKDIKGCYQTNYVPSKDDPRPETNFKEKLNSISIPSQK